MVSAGRAHPSQSDQPVPDPVPVPFSDPDPDPFPASYLINTSATATGIKSG